MIRSYFSKKFSQCLEEEKKEQRGSVQEETHKINFIHEKNMKNNYKCLFLDIDGTIIVNSSSHIAPYIGEGSKLVNKCDMITNLYEEGKVYFVLTTSRPEEYRDITEDELRSKNIPYHQLVMNLPHCKRVLINDYSNSNPYPSASAVNIERNSDKLNVFLNQI